MFSSPNEKKDGRSKNENVWTIIVQLGAIMENNAIPRTIRVPTEFLVVEVVEGKRMYRDDVYVDNGRIMQLREGVKVKPLY